MWPIKSTLCPENILQCVSIHWSPVNLSRVPCLKETVSALPRIHLLPQLP